MLNKSKELNNMQNITRNQTVYYKDWTDNDKIYPAKVVHAKRKYCFISVLVRGENDWETWEVNISDCEPTNDFKIIRPAGGIFGEMIEWKKER